MARLEAKKLVAIERDDADRRGNILRLTRQGRLVALAFDPDRIILSMISMGWWGAVSPRRNKLFSNNPSADRLAELTRSVEAGSIRPMVDTVFAMTDVAEAHRRLEAGGVRGKFVIDMQRA